MVISANVSVYAKSLVGIISYKPTQVIWVEEVQRRAAYIVLCEGEQKPYDS